MSDPPTSDASPSDLPAADPPAASTLRLDHFLQKRGIAQTGGHAKLLVQSGEVMLNGVLETRRRKKVSPGDVVECTGERVLVE